MASAASIARRTGRELVIVWVPDAHCAARLTDLVDYPGPILERATEAELARTRAAHRWNYMEIEEGAAFQAPILEDDPGGDVWIRSAYTLTSPHRDWRLEQAWLRALVPAAPVVALLRDVPRPSDLSVHVRMATGPAFDHMAHEAPENWPAHRHAELVEARQASHADRFTDRIDALIAGGEAETVFLAADLAETYDLFRDRYGARLRMIGRNAYDRSVVQLQYALADLVALASGRRFLLSAVSSFSDMALRLAVPGRPVERAGEDF